jgi:hypothetical protein
MPTEIFSFSQTTRLGGLEVRVLVTGHTLAGSGPAEDGGFLWVIKIRNAHFLRRGSKAVGRMSWIYGT